MGKIAVGLNAEFSRSSDKPFEWAVEQAAEMGYKYFEPMIHFGRELMSEAGYFHTVSMFDDPYRIKDACDRAGLKISGLQAHGPLGRPDVHGEYIKLAIRVAAEIGVPVVNTDEGIKAKWTTEEEDFVLIKYTLQEAAFIAERRGVKIGLEPHAQYSRHPDGLDRIYNLVKSPAIGINFDTGNAYLCGHDVYAWLERVARRLVHLHAKDISDGPLRGRARQGHRHARRLRLRRGRARLEADHRHRRARNARATSSSRSSAAPPRRLRQAWSTLPVCSRARTR